MLKNSMPMMSFGIIILLSGIVCFSGCDQSQQTTTDPNMLVAEYPEDTEAAALTEESQGQAVGMYVDAMMLNDLNEREQAIRKLNLALELDPTFSLAYSLKGDILQGMENMRTAPMPMSRPPFTTLGPLKTSSISAKFARSSNSGHEPPRPMSPPAI